MSKFRMSNTIFLAEIQDMLSGMARIPSKAFCNRFSERYSKGIEKLGLTGEWLSEKQVGSVLGYVLFDDFDTDGTEAAEQLKILNWVEFYEALEQHDWAAFEESVIGILGLGDIVGK